MRYIMLLSCIVFMVACDGDKVFFTESHPIESKSITQFPKQVIGKYINTDSVDLLEFLPLRDTSLIEITSNMVEYRKWWSGKVSDDDIIEMFDSLPMVGEKIVYKEDGDTYSVVKLEGDSALFDLFSNDTLFTISNTGILKKKGKSYYLNRKIDDNKWAIDKLEIDKAGLTFYKIKKDFAQTYINDTTQNEIVLGPMPNKDFKHFWKSTQEFQGKWVRVK